MSHYWGHRPGWPFPPGASASALMARRATHLNRQRYPGPSGEEQLIALCEVDNSVSAPGMILGSGFWTRQAGTLEVRSNPAGYTVGGISAGGVELRYTIPNPYTLSGYPVSCIFTMWEITTSTSNVFIGGYRSPATNTESLSVGTSSGNNEGMIFRYGGSQTNDSGGAQTRFGLLNTWVFVSYAVNDHIMFSTGQQSNTHVGTRDYMGGNGNDGIWILDNPDAFTHWNETSSRSILAATWLPREVTRMEIAQLEANPWAPYAPNNLLRDFGAMTGPAAAGGTVPFMFPMRGMTVS